jgi:acetyl esterase/lipase
MPVRRKGSRRIARCCAAAVFAALFSSASAGETPVVPPQIAVGAGQAAPYPGDRASFPNGVLARPGLVYSALAGYRPLVLDLYLPPDALRRPPEGFPLVVYIHGGAWLGGDRRRGGLFVDFPGVLAALSARGYVVAAVEYRLSREAAFPAQAQDVKAAIRWLRAHAVEYGVDSRRVAAWGLSAGGYLAGLAGVSCSAAALASTREAAPGVSDCLQGAVAWYGVFDMATLAAQARAAGAMSRDAADAPEWLLLGCAAEACGPDRLAQASPAAYVDAADPPMLLVTGAEDRTVPARQSLDMAETLKAAGVPHELLVIPGVDHSFFGLTPELTRDANLRALDATFRFLDATLKPPR